MRHANIDWRADDGNWVRQSPPPAATPPPGSPPGTPLNPAAADFSAGRNGIFLGDRRVVIKGVNWFGFETNLYTVHGLWAQSMDFLLDFVKDNGFNALRVPFSAEVALNLDTLRARDVNAASNPSLVNQPAGKVLDALVKKCRQRGILVMLDMHRLKATDGISEVWYSDAYPESTVVRAWQAIARRYRDEPTVFAADVKNEPHGAATWGGDPKTDWAAAAERIGDAILKVNPRLLIFVEGVDRAERPDSQPPGWWGGVVSWAARRPVRLGVPNRVVYAPHVYGPSVFAQPYFTDPTFRNCEDVWDAHFGDMSSKHAVCPTEWGGTAEGADGAWQARFAGYLASTRIDCSFYWCLNPNSGDTGGLLEDDWRSPVERKLRLARAAHPAPTPFAFS